MKLKLLRPTKIKNAFIAGAAVLGTLAHLHLAYLTESAIIDHVKVVRRSSELYLVLEMSCSNLASESYHVVG